MPVHGRRSRLRGPKVLTGHRASGIEISRSRAVNELAVESSWAGSRSRSRSFLVTAGSSSDRPAATCRIPSTRLDPRICFNK
jgi:hypothetical protein